MVEIRRFQELDMVLLKAGVRIWDGKAVGGGARGC